MKRRRFAAGVIAALVILAAGCRPEEKGPESAVDWPATAGGLTLSEAPQKVAVLSPSLAEIAADMGYADRLCGRAEECDQPAAVAALPSAGSMLLPDLDEVRSWVPDLVLTQSAPSEATRALLEQYRIPVAVVPSATTFDELREVYREVGVLFEGVVAGERRGDAQFEKLTAALAEVTGRVASEGAKKKTAAVYIADEYGHAATGDTVVDRILTAAGAVNIAAGGTDWTVDFSLLAQTPEVIFCPSALVDTVKASEALAASPAVQEGRVYGVDASAMERQGLRIAEAAESIARLLYPVAFEEKTTTTT